MTGDNDNTAEPNESDSKLPDMPLPAAINFPLDNRGNTYLHELCRSQYTTPADIRRALDGGADIDALNRQSLPPLALAIQYCRMETVACLLDRGAQVFMQVASDRFFNACTIAAECGTPANTQLLLDSGAALYANHPGMDSSGSIETMTPLHIAAKKDKPALIRQLADAGALPSIITGKPPVTPLMQAAIFNNAQCVTQLIGAGADIEQKNPDGNTALHLAAQAGSLRAVEALIDAGADPNVQNNRGETPLHVAAGVKGGVAVLKLLLEKTDAAVDIRTAEGKTALMVAAKTNNPDTVKALLSAKADPLLSDIFNRSAMSYSLENEGSYYERNTVQQILKDAEEAANSNHFEKHYKKYRP